MLRKPKFHESLRYMDRVPANFKTSSHDKHCVNTSQYEFYLTHVQAYKDRTFDSILLRENTGQGKLVLWHISDSKPCYKNVPVQKQKRSIYFFYDCCLKYLFSWKGKLIDLNASWINLQHFFWLVLVCSQGVCYWIGIYKVFIWCEQIKVYSG